MVDKRAVFVADGALVSLTAGAFILVMGVFMSGAYNTIRVCFGVVVAVGSYLITGGELSIITYLLFIFVAAKVYDPLIVAFFKAGELLVTLVSAKRIRDMEAYPVQDGEEDVESGNVLIGGRDVNEIAPETLLRYFAIVFQDVVLFNDTVYNNIKIGKKDATREEIEHAAELAGCMEFINRLPKGMETTIGENGKTLSGGERQRISIARAFLKDAPIVLLDEATASLDPENETLIQAAIGRLVHDKTVIIIAHRLRSVENCNRIIVLNDGAMEESGNHAELMQKEGLYHHLFKLQRESIQWTINT